jgi:uncharacterized protein
MLKDVLKALVASQQEWLAPGDKEIEREQYDSFLSLPPFVYIITGVRRAGKSTFLKQIMRRQNSLNYFNFEDSRAVDFQISDFLLLEEIFENINGNNQMIFFDEIQNVEGWERYVRDAVDRKKTILITGSNARLLSRELGTKLTGRHLDFEMFPFSYPEFLTFTGTSRGQESFISFLTHGGFPAYLQIGKAEMLSTLVTDILYRDIFSRYNLRNQEVYSKIVRFLLSNVSKEVSFNNIKNTFELGSATSAMDFFHYLTDSYLLFLVPMYHSSLKVQARNARKVYAIDQGLVHFYSASASPDNGRLLENTVFLELRRRGYEVWYFKGKRECDFIYRGKDNSISAIQVCWEVNSANEKRETEGLSEAMHQLGLQQGSIFTYNQEDQLVKEGKLINIVPVWKWITEI